MVQSIVPCAIATANQSNSPPIRKLAGRLLGCTCAAALWLNASVDELAAHEGPSYHLKEHEAAPWEKPAQQAPRQIHTKRRHSAQVSSVKKRTKIYSSAKQESHSKTARNRRPETKNTTKASTRHARSEMPGRGSQKRAQAKSRIKVGGDRLPETKAARSK